ncbi:hypothetical protein GCM10023152_28920 [Agromyces bauzanensis]|uniref:HTH cro/C1-type domain-containing protein n=1 Tax=Agromyces bauzanensis TaxID=1308924 RepID=A0A917USI0_9MICO|nr:hypothetical protein GCM10011372_20620 [Agromyces bauzanensis]
MFETMLTGWGDQQASRGLAASTVSSRVLVIRRFGEFAGRYPWEWAPGDLEDFTVHAISGGRLAAKSTIRGYHAIIRLFCDYLTDPRYDWASECERRFGSVPQQICHEWNTVAHLVDYEGPSTRRALTYDELEQFFAATDARVETIMRQGRKGALAALRDAQIFKTIYAYGLRRAAAAGLDTADLRPNGQAPRFGRFGAVEVGWGKGAHGSGPRRRTVLTLPELDWVTEGSRSGLTWLAHGSPTRRAGRCGRPSVGAGSRCGTSITGSRRSATSSGSVRTQRARAPAYLRHQPHRVGLHGEVRPRPFRTRVRVDHGDLHIGGRRLQEPNDHQSCFLVSMEDPMPTPGREAPITWHLRQLMAAAGMFQTTDLIEPLRAQGVQLSREQVFRLVTKTPERLNVEVLAALCRILDCTPTDLIEVRAVQVEPRRAAGSERTSKGPAIGRLRPVPAKLHRPSE